MVQEGYYLVDLNSEQGRREVMPYIYRMIDAYKREGIITSPTGFMPESWVTGEGRVLQLDSSLIAETLEEYIVDLGTSQNIRRVNDIINFIALNPHNPRSLNPYNPQAGYLLPQFLQLHDEASQKIALELWEYECRERYRESLESRVTSQVDVRIIGQVAAGKTSFLNSIVRTLALNEANIDLIKVEPEDVENEYPDLEYQYRYQYNRENTRGIAATLGSERLTAFCSTDERGLSEINIYGAGGHFRADQADTRYKYGASAFFVDFQLISDLANLEPLTDPDFILRNGEKVSETVLSVLARIQDWNSFTEEKLGVLTKLPEGTVISSNILGLIDKAFGNVLSYAYYNFEELNEQATWSGFELSLPEYTDIGSNTREWLPIFNDYPACTGSLEVLKRLVELSKGRNTQKNVQLIRLSQQKS